MTLKAWFLSLNGALTLSALALAAFLWTTFLDWRYVYGEFNLDVNAIGLGALAYAAYFGGWIWALMAAVRGSRRGLLVALIYALLLVVIAIMDLIVYCPSSCARVWLYYISNWTNLILGLIASAALVMQLRQKSIFQSGGQAERVGQKS